MTNNVFTDVMVDFETTGTMPDRNGVIQIAGVRFNLEEGTVDGNVFDRCCRPFPSRSWMESTREWWLGRNRDVYNQIKNRQEDPKVVWEDYFKWLANGGNQLRFWAKPTTFDYMFQASHFNDLGFINPCHYRDATDMNSFLKGLHGVTAVGDIPDLDIEFSGQAHNAIDDVFYQVQTLMTHYQNVMGERNAQ